MIHQNIKAVYLSKTKMQEPLMSKSAYFNMNISQPQLLKITIILSNIVKNQINIYGGSRIAAPT